LALGLDSEGGQGPHAETAKGFVLDPIKAGGSDDLVELGKPIIGYQGEVVVEVETAGAVIADLVPARGPAAALDVELLV